MVNILISTETFTSAARFRSNHAGIGKEYRLGRGRPKSVDNFLYSLLCVCLWADQSFCCIIIDIAESSCQTWNMVLMWEALYFSDRKVSKSDIKAYFRQPETSNRAEPSCKLLMSYMAALLTVILLKHKDSGKSSTIMFKCTDWAAWVEQEVK